MLQPSDPRTGHEPRVYSVSELDEAVRRLVEDAFGEIHVQGEVSNAKCMPSGHWYFTLKDESAQLAAVMFRSDAQALRFRLENGLSVRALGRLNVYAPQGRLQIVVRALLPVGQGALELAFQQLKRKLQEEGLFDAARKRSLPRFPRRVALVTSAQGAAVSDMLSTLAARWPLATAVVVPVTVQGDAAPPEIVRGIESVNRSQAADVLIVGRGGGSLEDLWAFNDERVARAIAASRIPVVSAVGHEVDFTIADFVADCRAPTPTAAAALVVPHQDEVRDALGQLQRRLGRALRRRVELPRLRLERLLHSYGLRRVRQLVPENLQLLDTRLDRLARAAAAILERRRARLGAVTAPLQALNPQAILERGYTYCVDATSGRIVTRAVHTSPGQDLRLHFADGARAARVLPPESPDVTARGGRTSPAKRARGAGGVP